MTVRPRSVLTLQLVAVMGLALIPLYSRGYELPLGDDAVREAYFLGQNARSANSFLSRYIRELPVSGNGPYVAEIELSTPYAQVVEASALHTGSYSAQDAEADYRKRGDSFFVRVKILFPPTDVGESDGFWRQVSVGLIQKKHIAAASVSGEPIYASIQDANGSVVIGANVFVQFSAAGIESGPVQVEVVLPGRSPVHAAFNLKALR